MKRIRLTLGFILNHPLAKKHPFKAFMRFMIWQLQSGISSGLIVKPFVSPVKFYVRKGLHGITGNIYSGLHEFNDMGFLLHFLQPDDAFFDVGANVGSYTLLASGVCGAKSFTLEPVPATFDILKKNIWLNKLEDKVTLYNSACGGESGTLTFTSDEDAGNHVIAMDEASRTNIISVPVITVDSMLVHAQPSLMKIDVEGFETEVLKGMATTLDLPSLKAIIIELNGSGGRYGYDEGEIHNLLLSKNFRAFSYDPFSRKLTEQQTYGSYNTIYCRDPSFIEDRLKSAKAINIMGELI